MTGIEARRQPSSRVECVVVVLAALAAAALLRQIPSSGPRAPDLLIFWWVLDMRGFHLPTVMATVGYLAGVGFLCGLVVAIRPTGIDGRVAGRVALCGSIIAALAATIPSIDSVTVAFLELPGVPIAVGLVYALARGTACLGRARIP